MNSLFTSTRVEKKCRKCVKSTIIFDTHTGDELCSKCGLVVEGKVISEDQEWRSFNSEGQGTEKSRIGGPNDVWLDAAVQSTAIVGGDKKHSRLSHAHEIATALNSSDRLLRTAFLNLKNISEFFQLKDNIVQRSKQILKDLSLANNLKTKTGDLYVLAVIYLACRQEQMPRTVPELILYNRVFTEKDLSRAIARIKKLLPSLITPYTSPLEYIPRICYPLNLSKEIIAVAEHVCNKAQQLVTRSPRPNSIAAGAVFLVCQVYNINIDPADIALHAKAGTSTVQSVYREMLPLTNKLLPSAH